MSHEAHPNPNPHDDPSAFPLSMAVLFSVILTVATVLGIKALNDSYSSARTNEIVASAVSPAAISKQHQIAAIRTPAWVDREKQILQIPIDQAIRLTAKEWAGGTTKPASPQPASRPSAPTSSR